MTASVVNRAPSVPRARGDADAGNALAGRGAARAKLEEQEPGVAEQEQRNDPDHDQRLGGAALRRVAIVEAQADAIGDFRQDQGRADHRADDHREIEEQRTRARAARCEEEGDRHPFRRDHHAPPSRIVIERRRGARGIALAPEGIGEGHQARTPRPKAKK